MKFLLRWIFRKQINEIDNQIFNLKSRNYELLKKIESRDTLITNYLKLMNRILQASCNSIFQIVKRNDSLIFVVKEEDSKTLSFFLYSLAYQRLVPRIYTTKCIKYQNELSKYTYLYIDDFLVTEQNIGNGSLLMENLIKYTKSQDFMYIYGMLSPVDKDHFDKLYYFYKKHGFEVSFDSNRESGHIKLKL